MKRFINPGSFAAAVLCFLLPFFNIKCNNMKLLTLSGVQMAVGANIDVPAGRGMFNNALSETEKPTTNKQMIEPLISAALLTLLAAAITTFVMVQKRKPVKGLRKTATIFAGIAFGILVGEYVAMYVQMKNIPGMATASYMNISWSMDIGYWLVLLICGGIIGYNRYDKKQDVIPPIAPDNAPPFATPEGGGGATDVVG